MAIYRNAVILNAKPSYASTDCVEPKPSTPPTAEDVHVEATAREPFHWTLTTFGPADRRPPEARVRRASGRPDRPLF